MSEFSTPAGWYPDGEGWERRWDGSGWTDERRRMAEPTQVRPPQQPPQQPPAAPAGPPAAPPQHFSPQPPQHYSPQPPPAAPRGYGQIPSGGVPQAQPQAYPQHGGYGYPPASPPRKSRLGLWIGLAVVLLLVAGTAITLVVLKPWDDGGTTADDPKDPKKGGGSSAVLGDVNGDGKGDARYYVYQDYDDVRKVQALSNGNGFDVTDIAVDPYREPKDLYLDWDGDGVNEHLTWAFVASGKQITLSSEDKDFPGQQNFTLSVSTLKKYGDPDIQLVAGDFDGDGDQDLAVAAPNDRVVDVSVLTNDGKGTFSDPNLWLSIPNAVIDVVRIYPGDFDKDGDTDLWVQLPAEKLDDEAYSGYYSGDRGFALLKSSGKNFEAGAVAKSNDYFDATLVGDVTGDGTSSIVGVKASSYKEELTVQVYDVSSGRLEPVAGFTGTSKIGQRNLQGASLSDVDGDGKADLVFVVKAYKEAKFTGVQVMKSTGAVLDPALVWAETPACKDDDCRIEFIGTKRY